MSFAGHVFDMIRRDKENRKLKERRRERKNDLLEKMSGSNVSYEDQDIDPEELADINRKIKERERKHTNDIARITCIFCIVGTLLIAVVWLIATSL